MSGEMPRRDFLKMGLGGLAAAGLSKVDKAEARNLTPEQAGAYFERQREIAKEVLKKSVEHFDFLSGKKHYDSGEYPKAFKEILATGKVPELEDGALHEHLQKIFEGFDGVTNTYKSLGIANTAFNWLLRAIQRRATVIAIVDPETQKKMEEFSEYLRDAGTKNETIWNQASKATERVD